MTFHVFGKEKIMKKEKGKLWIFFWWIIKSLMTFHDLCFISADEVKYEEIISMDPDDDIGNFIEEVN